MKDVLVRIADADRFETGARAAARLAADLGGSLTALHAVPIGVPPPTLYDPGLALAHWAVAAEREVREARAREAAFVDWAGAQGVRAPAWAVGAGHVPDLVAQAADWHDVAVLALEPAGEDPWATPDGVARIVLGTDLPCLVLPAHTELAVPCGPVVVAWNGSAQAIRALHAALPLLERAPRVVVLEGEARPASGLAPEFRLQPWIQARLPHVEYSLLEAREDAGAAILEAAAACEAGLLVMGAYGRSRAAEWLLGGVTRHVLQHADRPVLMRH